MINLDHLELLGGKRALPRALGYSKNKQSGAEFLLRNLQVSNSRAGRASNGNICTAGVDAGATLAKAHDILQNSRVSHNNLSRLVPGKNPSQKGNFSYYKATSPQQKLQLLLQCQRKPAKASLVARFPEQLA